MAPAPKYLPLALLFLAIAVPSYGQRAARAPGGGGGGGGGGAGGAGERALEVALGAPLVVECALRPEQRADWRLDGGAVPADMRPAERAPPAGLTARLTAPAARPHHAGLYSCARSSPRVRVLVTGADPVAAPEPELDLSAEDVVFYEMRGGNFSLNCSALASGQKVEWMKNGTRLEELPELRGHLQALAAGGAEGALLTLASRPLETDFGNYTCVAAGGRRTWRVLANPLAKLPADTNVVEGQKLKLTCKLIGMPYPEVTWTYSNVSELGNDSAVPALLEARGSLRPSEQGVPGGELLIEPAARSDEGWYRCAPAGGRPARPEHAAVSQLRVKDMYAALWPFLGICAEVLVLCAVILVYERRRSKPELDDSDTDNHDQKKS